MKQYPYLNRSTAIAAALRNAAFLPLIFVVSCIDQQPGNPLTDESAVSATSASLFKNSGGTIGDSDFCNDPSAPCGLGEGDCDTNAQCSAGLICVPNLGARYGLNSSVDICEAAHCTNRVWDANETGMDCGGRECVPCAVPAAVKGNVGTLVGASDYCNNPNQLCFLGEGDCDSNAQCGGGLVCIANAGEHWGFTRSTDVCEPAHCGNRVKDADELAVDCGNSCGSCVMSYCHDAKQDNGETGIDCGGTCGACAPTCSDGLENGTETGVDCGGTCGPCAPSCIDGIQNQGETGLDCGGPCGACPATCFDGIQNQDETAVDCGGVVCAACPTNDGSDAGVDDAGYDANTSDDAGASFVVNQGSAVKWAEKAGDALDQQSRAVLVYDEKTAYVGGFFTGTLTLGSYSLVSKGGNDIFIAAINTDDGSVINAVSFGDKAHQYLLGLHLRSSSPGSQICATGYFQGTLDFQSGPKLVASGSSQEGWVSCFTPDLSNFQAIQIGDGGRNTQTWSVAFDAQDRAIVTGQYEGTLPGLPFAITWHCFVGIADPGLGGNTTYVAVGSDDPNATSYCRSVDVDSSNRALITGYFTGHLKLPLVGGGAALDVVSQPPVQGAGAAVVGYDAFAAVLQLGPQQYEGGWSFGDGADQQLRRGAWSTNTSGTFYALGYIQGVADFGCGALQSADAYDTVLARLHSNGDGTLKCEWSSIYGGADGQYGDALTVGLDDSVYIAGEFETAENFGGFDQVVAAKGGRNAFAASFDSTGGFRWNHSFGWEGDQHGYGAAPCYQTPDGDGGVTSARCAMLVGAMQGSADFGETSLTSTKSTTLDIFTSAVTNTTMNAYATQVASAAFDGGVGDQWSGGAAISGEGRFVAFFSDATDLVANDGNNGTDIFVHDFQLGTTDAITTPFDSTTKTATGAASSEFAPAISTGGRYVAFASRQTDLMASGLTGESQVFLFDRHLRKMMLVSHDTSGKPGDARSFAPTMSSDGKFIAYLSAANGLDANVEGNGQDQVYVYDVANDINTMATIDPNNGGALGEGAVGSVPAISDDGNFVAFLTVDSHVDPNRMTDFAVDSSMSVAQVYRRDIGAGTTQLVSFTARSGEQHGSTWVAMSTDGRYLAFDTQEWIEMWPGQMPTNGNRHILFLDIQDPWNSRQPVDINLDGDRGGGNNGLGDADAVHPAISADGTQVSFWTTSGLSTKDSDGQPDIYVRDVVHATTASITVDDNGDKLLGNNWQWSGDPGGSSPLSRDGAFVAFVPSLASTFGHQAVLTPTGLVRQGPALPGYVTVVPSSSVTEGGSITISLSLASQPSFDVTVTISSSRPDIAIVSPSAVAFSPSNWASAQQITVTAVDDHFVDPNVPFEIKFTASSAGGGYDNLLTTVALTKIENDIAGVALAQTGYNVLPGQSLAFPFSLTAQPRANVQVIATVSGAGAPESQTLTISPAQWNATSSFTVSSSQAQTEGPESFIVSLKTLSADSAFDGLRLSYYEPYSVNVNVLQAHQVLSTPSFGLVTTRSGGFDHFDVTLSARPSATVTVGVSSELANLSRTGVAPFADQQLTFVPDAWNVPQRIYVTGVPDISGKPFYSYYAKLLSSSADLSFNAQLTHVMITNADAAWSPPSTIQRANMVGGGVPQANNYMPSFEGAISATGRYVAYSSNASNLVPGDTNGAQDVFVKDIFANTITRVSLDESGNEFPHNSASWAPAISADGRFIAFAYDPDGPNGGRNRVYLHDQTTNATSLASIDAAGNLLGLTNEAAVATSVAISPDGHVVQAGQYGRNVISGTMLRRCNGAPVFGVESLSTTGTQFAFATWNYYALDVCDGDTGGGTSIVYNPSGAPAMTPDARYLAYMKAGAIDVFDSVATTTKVATVTAGGGALNASAWQMSMSADGRFVTYISSATNIVAGDSNSVSDVFVRDMNTATSVKMVSQISGTPGNSDSWYARISADGSTIMFISSASNLVPGIGGGDTNGVQDVFVVRNPLY